LNQAGAANYVALPSSMTLAAIPSSAPFSAVTNASLVANWGANGNPSVTSYTVDLSTNGFSTVMASISTTSVSAQFSGLSPNASYAARVRAANAAGSVTPYALLGSTVTLSDAPLAAALSNVTSSGAQANWLAGADPAGTQYIAQISTDNFASVNVSSQTANLYAAFSSLGPNANHAFRVRALNSGGAATAFTSLGSTVTLANVPAAAAPSGVTDVQFTANWSANGNPGGTAYVAQVSTDGFVTINASSQTTAVSYLFTGL